MHVQLEDDISGGESVCTILLELSQPSWTSSVWHPLLFLRFWGFFCVFGLFGWLVLWVFLTSLRDSFKEAAQSMKNLNQKPSSGAISISKNCESLYILYVMDFWGFIYNHEKWSVKTSEDDLVYLLFPEQKNIFLFHAPHTRASSFTLLPLTLQCKSFS